MGKTVIATPEAPGAIGPYSQAIAIPAGATLLFCSGQIALLPQTGQLLQGDVAAQTEQVMRNLAAVLKAGGCDFSHVVKTTIFLANLGDFAAVNEVYGRHFPSEPPARSTIQAAGLPRGALVEIEVTAQRP
ncbi:MAG TPA: RidA family protein [Pseudomonadota bacterium]|nr:RidA family protein [Pseudomonadota bacterium]